MLEHGGMAPVIVHDDADIETMVPLLLKGGFYHAGQVCVSVQRIFLPEANFNRIAAQLVAGANKLRVGDPLAPETDVGPLIRIETLERIGSWVSSSEGEVLCGGKALSETTYAPTLIANPTLDAEVSTQEIFGPVICLYSYREVGEAIGQANAVPYSFQAAVFGKDIDHLLKTSKALHAESVIINDHTAFRADWMPFGGSMESGLGKGGIPYAIRDMTREKLVVVKS